MKSIAMAFGECGAASQAAWSRPRDCCYFMRRSLTCLAFCLTISLAASATNPNLATKWRLSQWQRRVWQIEDGLPHNYVTAISRDSERYLLVGTQTGIARFDGMRFTPLGAIADLWVFSLLHAADGVLGLAL